MARRKAFSVVGITLVVIGFLWLKVSPAVAAPPQNDDVGSATVISTLLFRDFLNVSEATTAPGDPDCFGQGATVWYAFTPAQDTDIDATTFGSNYDTTLSVYTGSPGALTQVACNNDAGLGFQSQVRFTASGGQTYYFMVGSPFLPGGSPSLVFTVDVALPPPSNDDFDSAIAIAGLPFTDANRDTRGATTASDDPSCFGQSATVWYLFSPSENMRVDVSTFGSNYSPALSVYTGSRGSLSQIVCAQFSASFPAVVGQTYFIMVSALPGPYPYSPVGGNLTLNVSGIPSPANDDFDSATVIPALPFTETLDTRGATTAFDDPSPTCGGGQIATVWYSFSPTQNVRVGVTSAGSNYPTVVSVYTGERGSLAGVACGFGQVSFDAGVGTSYFVMVGSASPFAPGGTLTFSAQGLTPAPNDDFGNATAITSLPFTDNLSGLGATAAADDPICWPASLETVWYTFTPAQNMRLEAIASGGMFSEIVSVFTGARGSLTSVACNPNQVTFDAVANTQVFIMIGSQFAAGGATVFTLREVTAPPNDDFDNATAVTSLPFTDNLNTTLATRAPDDPPFPFPFLCAGDQDATVWYSFSPSQPMRVEANTFGSNYSTTLYVLTGTRGALNQIACAIFSSPVSFTATPGTIYYIMVAGPPSGGNLRFNMQLIPPPANDDFANAVSVPSLPFSDFRDTRGATVADDDPTPSCGGRDATVWYSFTPTEDMRLEADTFGTSYYGAVSVYTGSRGSLTEMACSNPGPLLTPLRFDAAANQTYYIMVGAGPGLAPGSLSFHLTAIPPAPPNDDINSATLITDADLPFNATLDTRGASTAPDDPTPFCSGARTTTVWFSFTPGETMRIDADTFGSNYSANISVYTGAPGALSEVFCGFSQISFIANAGQRYFFFVASSGTSGGNLNFNVRRIPPPANDDFDSAVVITSLPFTDNRDTRAATTAPDDPNCIGQDATVWYQFTPDQDMRVEFSTSGSNYGTTLSVYTGQRTNLTQLGCTTTGFPGPSPLRLDLTAGTTYHIMVGAFSFGFPASGGNLVFSIRELNPPANDDFANATNVGQLPFTDSLNTRDADVSPDDPFPSCGGRAATVWYAFTPAEPTRIEANTFGSNYDTTLAVFTGSRGALTQVACNDNAPFFFGPSQLRLELPPGQTYYLMVGAQSFFGSPGGDLVFNVNFAPPGPANDIFENATPVALPSFTDSVNTREATVAPDDPIPFCSGARDATVWYAITPAVDTLIEINTSGSNYSVFLSVYAGSRGALNQTMCSFGQLNFNATAGTTYFLMASSSFGGGGDLVLSVQAIAPPANDDFANAIPITALPFDDNRDVRGATTHPDDPSPSCGGRNATVWYALTPAEQLRIEVNSFGNYIAGLSVFTGGPGAFSEVACNFNQVRFDASPGVTYYLMVGSPFGPSGQLALQVLGFQPPANDDFESAAAIDSLPFTDNRDTRGASVASDDPFPFCSGFREATVWYSLTSAQTIVVDLNTFGSSYSTTISVFTGSRGALNQTVCGFSQVSFTADANATYFIMVASTSNAGGDLVFAMQVIPPPANDEFANAIPIITLPFDDNRDVRGATTHPDDPSPSCGGRSATVWYTLSTTEELRIEVNSFSNYTAGLSVFTGGPGTFSEVACNFNQVRFSASPGITYYLMVGSSFGLSGQLGLQVLGFRPPANDDIASAALIPAFPFNTSLDTRGATAAADDPFPSCTGGGGRDATVWYTFAVDHTVRIEFNTFGSNYSTSLSVYTGSPGALAEIACGGSLARFTAVTGTTYYLMVGAFYGASGDLVLNGQELPPPANDDIANAVEIASLPFSDFNRDTRGATTAAADPTPSCTGSSGREATVWYAFTAPEDLRIDISVYGDYPASATVFTGSPGALAEVACGYPYSSPSFRAASGQRYFIMVGGVPGGSIYLTVQGTPVPANDDFDHAALITATPFTESRDTRGATTASDDPFPSCTGSGGRNATVWYAFTSAQDMLIRANTFGSDYPATLAAYTGTRDALSEVACGGAEMSFTASAGASYFFMVGSQFGAGGNLVFSVEGFLPANFTVNSTVDAVDANPGDGACATGAGECTLRAAIQEANAWPADDTITLPAGTYQLTLAGAGEDAAATGDLDITSNLTINGAGAATTTIDGNGGVTGDRVIQVFGSIMVNMTGVTIQNGNASGNFGGGIFNSGVLTLVNVTISNNAADFSGGLYNDGMLMLTNSSVSSNMATASGGGILNNAPGIMTLTNSIVNGNTASGGANGISNNGGTLTLINSTVSNNLGSFAGGGGGLNNSNNGTVTLIGTTFSGNTATNSSGGAIEANSGMLTVTDSTFSGNSAAFGGGLSVTSGSVSLNNVTMANNTATSLGGGLFVFEGFGATINAKNTVLAGNLGPADSPDCNGMLSSQGYNLVQDTTGCTIVGDLTGNLTGVNPLLGPLQDNGGPTLTHALLPGSPAIDAGNPAAPGSGGAACEATDQRGVARPIGAACDIGAFEAEVVTPPLAIGVTIDQNGSLGRGGRSATIHGQVTCSQPAHITLSGTLTQRSEGRVIAGSFEIVVECDGKTAWSATVRPNKGRFEEGKVTVAVTASAVDPASGQIVRATASRKVQLKKSR